ncbi:MAG: Nramp family divalent metal transporter [Nanoarchaeota archaeon]
MPPPLFSWKRVALFLAVLGPGIITATVGNDASGITTYSLAGADFGYGLLWTLIPILITLALVQEMAVRMGVVTGQGLTDLIREHFGVRITFFMIIGIVIANTVTTVAEFSGIAAAAHLLHLPSWLVVISCGALIWILIFRVEYQTLERVFLFMVLFYLAYVVSGFMAHPDWGEVVTGLTTPTITFTAGYLLLLIGVIGTTITPWMQIYLQSSVVEKGIQENELRYARIDSLLGVIITVIIAFFIIVATASTLFKHGIHIGTAEDAALALAPFAGNFSTILFGVGLFAAGLLGAFILPLATAFTVCEGIGWESGVNKRFKSAPQFYIIFTVLILLGIIIPLLPNAPLIDLMLASQVINGILLPVILISMIKLVNNKRLMGRYTNPGWYNVIIWAVAIMIILATIALVISTFI